MNKLRRRAIFGGFLAVISLCQAWASDGVSESQRQALIQRGLDSIYGKPEPEPAAPKPPTPPFAQNNAKQWLSNQSAQSQGAHPWTQPQTNPWGAAPSDSHAQATAQQQPGTRSGSDQSFFQSNVRMTNPDDQQVTLQPLNLYRQHTLDNFQSESD